MKKLSFHIGDEMRSIDAPAVMGILNLTPDSFFDGGQHLDVNNSLKKCEEMISEGAAIIDIGAYSSRPNATEVSQEEEIRRLSKHLPAIHEAFPKALLSVDTFRSEVARYAAENGASMINDISGGKMDSNMIPTVAELQLPYIIMHMQGRPQNMQDDPSYQDVTKEVRTFLEAQTLKAREAGIRDIIIDPGFGFGKNVEHNYRLMRDLDQFGQMDAHLLIGVSRKSMINKVINSQPASALNGSTVLHTYALLNGADILRAHDVREAKEAITIVSYLQKE